MEKRILTERGERRPANVKIGDVAGRGNWQVAYFFGDGQPYSVETIMERGQPAEEIARWAATKMRLGRMIAEFAIVTRA